MKTVHLLIKGNVQGVFYRASAKDVAEQLNVKGWIRNTEEGNVEATVSGDDDEVDRFVEWCRKGPSKAEVAEVIVTSKPDQGFLDFQIIRG
jgi:acylphosphatase